MCGIDWFNVTVLGNSTGDVAGIIIIFLNISHGIGLPRLLEGTLNRDLC